MSATMALLVAVLFLAAGGGLLAWMASVVAAEPGSAAAVSPTAHPAAAQPEAVTVEAVVVFWSEHDDVALLDCVRSDGPDPGTPFAATASLPEHPALMTATENLLDRWCLSATPIRMTAVTGRHGPELRLSDGESSLELAVVR